MSLLLVATVMISARYRTNWDRMPCSKQPRFATFSVIGNFIEGVVFGSCGQGRTETALVLCIIKDRWAKLSQPFPSKISIATLASAFEALKYT
ncbi:hypothetical protein LMG33810_001924 [Carnimonas sp. LMG 33810]